MTTKTTNDVQPSSLDFTGLIERKAAVYLSRPAIEQHIAKFFQDLETPLLLITGEPGSGKTALAAAEIKRRKCPHYFLRQGHNEFGLWRDPYGFLTTVGFQLRALYGDEIFPRSVSIDVGGRIRNVMDTGEVVGAEIERLVPVPWHSTNLNVDLNVEEIAGKVTGVRIKEIVESYRSIPLRTFRQMAFVEPLLRIHQLDPKARLALWVDGLDEEFAFGSGMSEMSLIGDLLPLAEELLEIGNLDLVISSRPGTYLDRFKGESTREFDMGDGAFTEDTAHVIEQLIEHELADPDVRQQIQQQNSVDQVREVIVDKEPDNFLFVDQFFKAIRSGHLQDLIKGGLPPDLDDIYARTLDRLVREMGNNYLDKLHLLVNVLAVAEAQLTLQNLVQFTGLQRTQVKAGLVRLQPYLDKEDQDGHLSYSLYHKSFRDCLFRDQHIEKTWSVDPVEANSMIASFYLRSEENKWTDIDEYGLLFLTQHLQNSTLEHQERLIELVSEPWRRRKREYHKANWAFAEDLQRAAACASNLPFTQAAAKTVQLAMLHTALDQSGGTIPKGALEALVLTEQTMRAFDYVNRESPEKNLFPLLAEFIRGLHALPVPKPDLARRVLKRGLTALQSTPDHGSLVTLLEPCPPSGDDEMKELVEEAIGIFQRGQSFWMTAPAMVELARLLTEIDDNAARNTLFNAQAEVEKLTSSKSMEVRRLMRVWSDFNFAEAIDVFQRMQLRCDHYAAATILDVGRVGTKVGHNANDEWAYTTVKEQFLPNVSDPEEEALVQVELARMALERDNNEEAKKLCGQALKAIDSMGGSDDPKREFQNRPSQAASARIKVAACQIQCDPEAGRDTLHKGWRELDEHGSFNLEHETLILAQINSNPDLLDAELEHISDRKLRSELLASGARYFVRSDPSRASDWLERALIDAESAEPTRMNPEYRAIGTAKALGFSMREEARMVLDAARVNATSIVDWQIDLMESLVTLAPSEANSWLLESIHNWSQGYNNFTMQQIAGLKRLPRDIVGVLRDELNGIDSPSHRALLGAVLGWHAARTGEDDARRYYAQACADAELGEKIHEVLAFVAGNWWESEPEPAQQLWLDVLLRDRASNPSAEPGQVHFRLSTMLRALALGSPIAALPFLLTVGKRPQSDSLFLVVPGPGVDGFLAGGMEDTDRILASSLAAVASQQPDGVGSIANYPEPLVRGLAAAEAALLSEESDLQQCLECCEIAINAAQQVGKHHLHCFLLALTARALWSAGFKEKACDYARSTTESVFSQGSHFNSVYHAIPYPQALGHCFAVLANCGEQDEAVQLLWDARHIGRCYENLMQSVAETLVSEDPAATELLLAAEKKVHDMFV